MNKKKKMLRLIESISFCVLLLLVVFAAERIVERKAGIEHLQPFFDHADEYDVLFVGDSMVVNAVLPLEMWEEYGVAGYNLASYGNTIPVTFWTMINALDYASPELMVIGIKDVEKSYKLSGSSGDLHTAFDGYPLSANKIRAIEDLTDDPYAVDDDGVRYADMKWEYYFTLGKYHDRWSDLSENDFCPEMNVQAGGNMLVGVDVPVDYELIDEWDAAEAYSIGFDYLRKMIEECQTRGIEVLLVHMPYPASEKAQRNANAVIGIAEEYGVEYIDFVSLDHVADYATDCYDPSAHLNASGAKKVSDYLGRFMEDHYDLPDRRSDSNYGYWWSMYDRYIDHKRAYVKIQTQLHKFLVLLHDKNFSVVAAVEPGAPVYEDDMLYTLMHNVVREHVFEEDAYMKWSNSLFPLAGFDEAAYIDGVYLLAADRKQGTVLEWLQSEGSLHEQLSFGRLDCEANETTGSSVSVSLSSGKVWKPDLADEHTVHFLVVDDRDGEMIGEFSF